VRRDRRLETIIEAAAAVLGERGLHGCTMRDVAAAAGISPASLYRHVQGREELLYLVLERVFERALRSAEAARAARGARERLRAFVTDHIRRVLAFPAEARLLQISTDGLPHYLRRRLEEQRSAYLGLARDIVDAVGPARPVRRATAERRVHLLLGMADRVAQRAAEQEGGAPRADRLARPVLEMFLHGVKGGA
jgi:AcrR family transcriptional regulator